MFFGDFLRFQPLYFNRRLFLTFQTVLQTIKLKILIRRDTCMKKTAGRMMLTLLTLAMLFAAAGCSPGSVFQPEAPHLQEESAAKAKVIRVKDGDTFVASSRGKEYTVRLIGIDTPESVHPDKSRNTPEGKEASEYLKRLITGKTVYLEQDVSETDRYGRVLAYCWIDSDTMVNALLLEQGYAVTMTVPPDVKYEDWFERLQNEARDEQRGFWKDYFKEDGNDKN